MRVAIVGSRAFSDYPLLQRTIEQHCTDGYGTLIIDEIISGGAKGADELAARFARAGGFKLTEFIPDWDKHGKRAGFLRNEDIIAAADFVIAFWGNDPESGELSRGTANSLSIAKRLKKRTLIVYF